MYRIRFALAAMLLFTCPLAVEAAVVDEIVIEGNKKTRTGIVRQELWLREGDEITQELIDKSRQSIMELGLFKKVDVVHREEDGINRLVVTLNEKKHDWYILPKLDRNADGDITLGINWRANNLNGLNQNSKLVIAHKKYEGATEDEQYGINWKFTYPRVVGTQFSAFTSINAEQVNLDEERDGEKGSYDRQEYSIALGVGRWFSPSGVSQGLHASLGVQYQQYDHQLESGTAGFFDDVRQINFLGEVSYRNVHDLLYSRKGYATGLLLKLADDSLGSDRSYFHQYAFYRRYISLPWKEHTNFNFQVQLGSGNRSLFGDPIYDLSGQQTLRGYAREVLEGDAYMLVNTQFLTPIFGEKNLRAGVLFDFGNAYDSLSEFGEGGLESGFGVSLRWKLKQWVDTEIRLDYAEGLGDEGEGKFYVSGNAMF